MPSDTTNKRVSEFRPTPYTTKAYDEHPFSPPLSVDVLNDLSKRAPISSVQTMESTDPITHHLASNARASTSRHYEADLTKLKEDLANMFKAKLRVDKDISHLHQKPYPNDFDFVSYPVG